MTVSETKLPRVFAGLFPLNLAVQAVSFAAWIAFAHVLGATTSTDAYLLGFSVPVLVYGILLAAIRTGAIPGLTDVAARGDPNTDKPVNELVAAAIAASAAIAVVVTALATALAPLVLRPDPHFVYVTRLTILELSPLTVLGALTGVLSAILAVRGSFGPAVAVMILDPFFRVIFVLAWGGSLGIQSVILANLAGGGAAVAVLWALVRRKGIRLRLVRPAPTAFVRSVVAVSAPLMIASSVLQTNPIVDRAMAGSLGAGSVTSLDIGLRLVPSGLLFALVAAPLVATWAARKAQGGWPALQESLHRALSSAFVFIPPLVVIGIVLRDEVVTLAFHGGAYSAHAASETSAVFGMSLLGMPAGLVSVIFSTLFIVQRETKVPMKIGFANVVLNVALNFAFRPLFGVAGIALSTSVTYGLLNVAQYTAARRRWGQLLPASLAPSLIWVAGALAASGGVAALLLDRLPAATTRLQAFASVSLVGCTGLLVYGAVMLLSRGVKVRAGRVSFHRPFGLETRS